MFGSSKKKEKGKRKSRKGKQQEQDYSAQQYDVAVKAEEPAPDMMEVDPNGMPYGETERALLKLHQNLIDFYSKHNPEKVDEEVLTILMQFFIDAGGVALNKKLMKKYGEDLQTFKRLDDPIPLPPTVDARRTSATMDRLKRQSYSKELESMGIDVPPPPTQLETTATAETVRKSLDKAVTFNHRPKKKNTNPELMAYKQERINEFEKVGTEVDNILDMLDAPAEDVTEDPALQLFLLDKPGNVELSVRDKLEAFYSVHDESKLDNEKSMEKFESWVKENSLSALSNKLRVKYSHGIEDYDKLAKRRRNLEDLLTKFYLKHDRPKLDTRWTILKILSWTIQNGVPALNNKFITRYGHPVVKQGMTDLDNDLDI